MIEKLPVSCNKDCGGGCPLIAHVEHGRLSKITNNPLRKPHMIACPRGLQMHRAVYAPDRIRRPLLRSGERGSGSFREIPWDEALDLIADRLRSVRSTFGRAAVLPLGGSGGCIGAVHNTALLKDRFFRLLKGHTEATGNYSEHAIEFTSRYLFGGAHTGLDPGTLQHAAFIVLWGANIVDTRFGCEMESRIREARNRGVPVVVIDPRQTLTSSRLGTEWIPVFPGTDSAFMLAVLWVLIEQGLVDRGATDRLSFGFETIERYVRGDIDGAAKTPQWAQALCGAPAQTIEAFAERYGTTKPAALLPGLSMQRTVGGEESVRLAVTLQIATGNVGIRGGSTGANILNKLPLPPCGTIELKQTHEGPTIPLYRWPDAVLEGRQGDFPTDIHALYLVGCNYLSQGSDLAKNLRAFRKIDFAVCHDYFLTPTARYCDVVLPVTTFLERADVVFPRSNHLFYSHRAIAPLHEARNDYDIFCGLAERLGFLDAFSEERTADQWLEHIISRSAVQDPESFKSTGIHEGDNQMRVGLSEFAMDPEGHPLDTPSGKIQLDFAPYGRTGFAPHPECRVLEATADLPLRLVTPHARFRIHSQNHNIPWFRRRQDDRLWMHPKDARLRRISDGQQVLVRSDRGAMRVRVRVTDEVMAGVVSAHEGVWPELDGQGIETAGSVNILTSTEPTTPSMGSRTHSVLVEVSLAGQSETR
jgi:anaerobic dimethyl sulfoxide reductase subunit A